MRWPVTLRGSRQYRPSRSLAGNDKVAARTTSSLSDLLDVFTPARPKISGRWLTGRRVELDRIVSAVTDERCHVVLYSKRGRGKTSLTNASIEVLRSRGVAVARFSCHGGSSFHEIVKGLLRDLPGSLLVISAEQRQGVGCEGALPSHGFSPAELVLLPSRLTCQKIVCVVDEFDRVEDAAVRSQFADAIKHLSDRGSQLLFLLIGVSENLDDLLGQHESIRRSVIPVALPLLTREEVHAMVKSGAKEAGFDVERPILDEVAVLSGGIPHLAQLIALRTMQATAARRGTLTFEADLRQAAAQLVQEADPRVTQLYARLTSQGRDRVMIDSLCVIATAEHDCHGRFMVFPDEELVELGNGRMPLACWKCVAAAGVVSQSGSGSPIEALIGDRDVLTFGLLLKLAQQSQSSEPTWPATRVQSELSEGALIELADTR